MLTFIIVSNYKSDIEFPQKNLATAGTLAKLLYLYFNLLSITFFSKLLSLTIYMLTFIIVSNYKSDIEFPQKKNLKIFKYF